MVVAPTESGLGRGGERMRTKTPFFSVRSTVALDFLMAVGKMATCTEGSGDMNDNGRGA